MHFYTSLYISILETPVLLEMDLVSLLTMTKNRSSWWWRACFWCSGISLSFSVEWGQVKAGEGGPRSPTVFGTCSKTELFPPRTHHCPQCFHDQVTRQTNVYECKQLLLLLIVGDDWIFSLSVFLIYFYIWRQNKSLEVCSSARDRLKFTLQKLTPESWTHTYTIHTVLKHKYLLKWVPCDC